MAIRLRHVEGVGLIAICAARSVEKPGDIYLDDGAHHALSVKFGDDFASEGLRASLREVAPQPGVEDRRPMYAAMDIEESNNPNREWWDRTYGAAQEKS